MTHVAIVAALVVAACTSREERVRIAAEAADPGSSTAPAAPTPVPRRAPAVAPSPPAPPPADPARPPDVTPGPPVTERAPPGATAALAAAADTRPRGITAEHVALAEDVVARLARMGEAVAGAGKDCRAAARAITAGVHDLGAVVGAAGRARVLGDVPAVRQWFQKTYGPRLTAAIAPFMAAAQTCAGDKDFVAAVMSMSELEPARTN